MTKNRPGRADREAYAENQLHALEREFPDSTPERRKTMLHRYTSGKSGPSMKRIARVLRDQGLQ